MEISIEMALGAYGALLSTGLAVLAIFRFWRERPRISVNARIIVKSASKEDETHGVLRQAQRGDDLLWEEVDVEISVRNSGAEQCQISGVFVETGSALFEVAPTNFPVILTPNTGSSALVQPEYIVPKKITLSGQLLDESVSAFGVFDALGNKHAIPESELNQIVTSCRGLPLRTSRYKHRKTGRMVVAFQVKDNGALIEKK